MNDRNKHSDTLINVLAVIMIFLIVLAIIFGLKFIFRSKEKTIQEPAIPEDYAIFYDDNNEMIIAPSEYHFEYYEDDGSLILTK